MLAVTITRTPDYSKCFDEPCRGRAPNHGPVPTRRAGSQATALLATPRSERRDLVRLVGEPARDRAAEDRHDADQENGDERDKEAVFGHGDTLFGLDELASHRANAIHGSPLIEIVMLH